MLRNPRALSVCPRLGLIGVKDRELLAGLIPKSDNSVERLESTNTWPSQVKGPWPFNGCQAVEKKDNRNRMIGYVLDFCIAFNSNEHVLLSRCQGKITEI